MSKSPFPYTCELCGAEGLTDDGMRRHTVEAHVATARECPFCGCAGPQLVEHVQRAHLHYLTPERELMAFIDDQSPSIDEDSKMTTTDSCSFNTPGSVNGWQSPDTSSSYQNGAISKNYHNGFHEKEFRCYNSKEKDEDGCSRSPKNINLSNGMKNINLSNGVNGVIPKKFHRQSSVEADRAKGFDKKGAHSSPSHNSSSYEGSPNKHKLHMTNNAGQGSPLRSQLALNLKPNTPKKSTPTPSPTVQCLLCEFTSTCPRKLEEHINRAHFDLTSPSVIRNANENSNANSTTATDNPTLGLSNPTITLDNPTLGFTAMAMSPGPQSSSYQCPICEQEFTSGTDVEMHVNVDHRDILSPQKPEQVDNASCEDVVMMEESPVSNCPVCCQPLPLSQHELIEHIEEHFSRGSAVALTDEERQARRTREEQEFQMLRAQYGMEEDSPDGYTARTSHGLKRAVYSGALSVAGYYERSVGLRRQAADGADAGASRTPGLVPAIVQLNASNPSIAKTYLCTAVDHFASTYGDRGWGCGYRNMQMVLSALVRHPPYARALSAGGVTARGDAAVPAIPRLQHLVERAWEAGFDTQGSEQLGSKLYNTRKWIGACEVVTVLSSLRIKCSLVDFHKPTGAEGAHPALFEYVLQYLSDEALAFKAPLYLQHQGHSRTIIGYEKHKDGKATLLILDPSHSPAQVRGVVTGTGAEGAAALRLLRRGSAALRARQYQLLAVTGLATDEEYEASKVLRSDRIP